MPYETPAWRRQGIVGGMNPPGRRGEVAGRVCHLVCTPEVPHKMQPSLVRRQGEGGEGGQGDLQLICTYSTPLPGHW